MRSVGLCKGLDQGVSFYLSLLVAVCQSWRSFFICHQGGLECKGPSKGLTLLTSIVSLWKGENLCGTLN